MSQLIPFSFSKVYHKTIIEDEKKAKRMQEIEDKEKDHIGSLSSDFLIFIVP